MNDAHQTIALSLAAGLAVFGYGLLCAQWDGSPAVLTPIECAIIVAAAVQVPAATRVVFAKVGRWVAMGATREPKN